MDYEAIAAAMSELDEDTLMDQMRAVMADGGADAFEALNACQKGMEKIGELFDEGEYFLGDLIYAGEIMNDAVAIIKPALTAGGGDSLGKAIICTVKEDLHDIGKNIVKSIMEAGGFEVIDLGNDTPPETIVNAAIENGVKIIALSCVLTLGLESMKKTVKAFEEAGIRNKVRIVIGGAPVTETAFNSIGADAWASSPQKTVSICRAWAAE